MSWKNSDRSCSENLKSCPLELSKGTPGNCSITVILDLNEEFAQRCQLVIRENSSYYFVQLPS